MVVFFSHRHRHAIKKNIEAAMQSMWITDKLMSLGNQN